MTPAAPAPKQPYHRFSHEAMTTGFDALIIHPDVQYARSAAYAVFAEVDRMERLLNRHEPGTDISQINALRPGQWMRVTLEVLECLEIAARAFIETGGAFDVAFRSTAGGTRPSAMNFLLLSRPESDTDEPMEHLVGIDPQAADHGFDGAEIDLGGVGKGYALDQARAIMRDWELDNYLLHSGTSTVLASGAGPAGEGWPVGVSGDYRDETGIRTTQLRDCSMSGSGTAVKGDHIRNPHTGEAATALCAWALHPSAAWTDCLTTALMIMTQAQAREFCQQHTDISAIALYPAAPGATPEVKILVHGPW